MVSRGGSKVLLSRMTQRQERDRVSYQVVFTKDGRVQCLFLKLKTDEVQLLHTLLCPGLICLLSRILIVCFDMVGTFHDIVCPCGVPG